MNALIQELDISAGTRAITYRTDLAQGIYIDHSQKITGIVSNEGKFVINLHGNWLAPD
jgi:hypothetical protein